MIFGGIEFMKKIYLCGAMGCYENPEEYMFWRRKIVALYNDVADVFDPSEFYSYEEQMHKTEKEIMEYELYNLKRCDFVILNLDRIHESIGSIMEIAVANENNIPIIAFGSLDKYEHLYPWLKECILRHETSMPETIEYINKYFLQRELSRRCTQNESN